jgi:hypothetical protein
MCVVCIPLAKVRLPLQGYSARLPRNNGLLVYYYVHPL